jgi:hypothetical protein
LSSRAQFAIGFYNEYEMPAHQVSCIAATFEANVTKCCVYQQLFQPFSPIVVYIKQKSPKINHLQLAGWLAGFGWLAGWLAGYPPKYEKNVKKM